MKTPTSLIGAALMAAALALPLLAAAQEAVIRKNLTTRVPGLTEIDEVSKTPMNGLFEVRVGNDILYTDAEGNFLIQGQMLDTRAGKNLTAARIEKLTAIAFKDLPLKNAFTLTRGDGKRKLAVFVDPNCGYCKRFEKDLAKVDNITVHFFLIPILGDDSVLKSRQVWCAADKGKTWVEWMQRDITPKGAGS